MFLFFLFLIYFFLKEFFLNLLYVLFNLLVKLDDFFTFCNNLICFKQSNLNYIINFIFLYFFFFIWYVYLYIISNILLQLYFLFDFQIRKCLMRLIETLLLFLIFFFLGIFKSLFLFNWFILFSFIKYYRKSKKDERDLKESSSYKFHCKMIRKEHKDKSFFEILFLFLNNIVMKYKDKSYVNLNTVIDDKKKEFLKTTLKYGWFFIYDLFSLFLFLLFVYYIKYKILFNILTLFLWILMKWIKIFHFLKWILISIHKWNG